MNRFELSEGTAALTAHRLAWDELARQGRSPFLTYEWLAPWSHSRKLGQVLCATLCASDGTLLAGAVMREVRGGLASAADVHSGDWDVVAVDDQARRLLWQDIARCAPKRMHLSQMRLGSAEVSIAIDALRGAGYAVLPAVRELRSPYVKLPASFDELLARRSRNARKQLRKQRKGLESAGEVRFRTSTGGAGLEPDFASFLRVEASGWKGREGTAILSQPSTERLYRSFAREAAARGWLRLHLLELDGKVVAGGLVISFAGEGFFLKTGYDDQQADLSPGAVLTAEILRDGIREGLRGIDMLGRADQYKMTWTDEVRPRQRLRIYRGRTSRVADSAWERALRPQLIAVRDRAREDPRLRSRLERAMRVFRSSDS